MCVLSSGHEAAGASRADDGVVPAAAPHASLRAEPGVLYDGRGKPPCEAASSGVQAGALYCC